MTVKRVICGNEIEIILTGDELYEAYLEKQVMFDREDVTLYYDGVFADEEVEAIAQRSRTLQDKYDMSVRDAIDEAIRDLELWHKVETNISNMEAEILNTIKVNVAF